MARVVVIDDERSMREFMELLLERDGHEVATAKTVEEARLVCERTSPALVFADLKLPDGTGIEILEWLRDHQPDAQVVIMTAFGTAETAVRAMRMGAYDYQIKPARVDALRAVTAKALEKYNLIKENEQLLGQLSSRYGLSKIVGRSNAIQGVLELVERVASSASNVLIEGESGTGKELVARAVHDGSPRRMGPFVAINCGAIPETLIEAELFGHVAGAFTGASKARAGLFEAAGGGTLLLDEIGELPASMQVKLLRALQERKLRRVGEEHERCFDARIIAATNRDLQERVKQGAFREDLFYRLNVVRIRVPPLRERPEDISLLARAFVMKYAEASGKEIVGIDDSALGALCAFPFPGNVRELENYVERAVTLCQSKRIELADLPDEVRGHDGTVGTDSMFFPEAGMNLESRLQQLEAYFVSEAMRRAGGVKTKAAELLGLSFRSLRYRLRKLGIDGSDEGGARTGIEGPGQRDKEGRE